MDTQQFQKWLERFEDTNTPESITEIPFEDFYAMLMENEYK